MTEVEFVDIPTLGKLGTSAMSKTVSTMTPPDNSSSPLILRLFGPFEALVVGKPLPPLRSRQSRWLLALLTLKHGREIERSWLAGTLWPDSAEPQALTGLRQLLTDLRRALGGGAVRLRCPSRHVVSLDLKGADVDLIAFDDAVARGDLPSLERAVALYRGPFLEGCLEEWAYQERAVREDACLSSLERIAVHARTWGDHKRAIDLLHRAIGVDPLRESAHRRLMETLVDGGNAAEAILTYRDLRTRLHREAHAEPDPRTTELFRRIRACSRNEPAPHPATDVSPPTLRIPHPVTPLIGREAESAAIITLLTSSRLLTLVGTGGLGKTRLALRVAESVLEEFPDGAWFVDLSGIDDPRLVASAAATLGVREDPNRTVTDTLQTYLADRSLLMILDNCEHLLEACSHLAETLLPGCPRLRILATSRAPLAIVGEALYRVPSLSLPEATETVAELSRYDAVRLFVARTEAVQPGFSLTEPNAASVAEVCRQLDGIPLALELAAARLRAMPLEAFVNRLDDAFRLLTGGSRTAPSRHRSLQATIEWSYRLLSEPERTLLRRLSVFAGGWTLDAAEQVASGGAIGEGEALDLLTALVDSSLVAYEPSRGAGRYRLLEPIRQYARERLIEVGEEATVRRSHLAFFVELGETLYWDLKGSRQKRSVERFDDERANFNAALSWASKEQVDPDATASLVGALGWFWELRGAVSESRERLTGALANYPEATPIRARLLRWASLFVGHTGDRAAERRLIDECIRVCRACGDGDMLVQALRQRGVSRLWHDGDPVAACRDGEEALSLAEKAGDYYRQASCQNLLGQIARESGNEEKARARYEASLALFQNIGDRYLATFPGSHLGLLEWKRGNHSIARARFEDRLAIQREFGDLAGSKAAMLFLAKIAISQGDYNAARQYAEESRAIIWDGVFFAGFLKEEPLFECGHAACHQGDLAAAAAYLTEHRALARQAADPLVAVRSLEGWGIIAARCGRASDAARLFGRSRSQARGAKTASEGQLWRKPGTGRTRGGSARCARRSQIRSSLDRRSIPVHRTSYRQYSRKDPSKRDRDPGFLTRI